MQSVGIIGKGILGTAVARGFMEMCEIRAYDAVKEKATHSLAEAATADVVFVCLPTPALADGQCDVHLIDEFLHLAYSEQWWSKSSCFCIRSTVPIGYTERKFAEYLRSRPLLHSPEFLTARVSITDFQCPSRNIIGTPQMYVDNWSIELQHARDTLDELYKRRFPGVQVQHMPSNGSELVKLACNTFFAAKVTMFNLFAEISAAYGVDWEQVRGGILSDGRVAHAHTAVTSPGGFSGSCLPKDLADLFTCATAAGIDAEILRAIHERNKALRPDDPNVAHITRFPRASFGQSFAEHHD